MPLTITPPWENPIWYETDVQLALRDLLKMGDTLFDVGANIGGLSSPASRSVGPRGKVIAFEASPRTIGQLHENMIGTHSTNVYIEYGAVCDQEGAWLPFYYGHIPNADSLSDTTGEGKAVYVRTLRLDDYCRENSLEPDVIKMDIEGAEMVALKGFEGYLSLKRPPLVLEVANSGSDAHQWLLERKYQAINLASYAEFAPAEGSPGHSNVLYVHPTCKRGEAYLRAKVEPQARIGTEALVSQADTEHTLFVGNLEAGRYILEIETTERARLESSLLELSAIAPGQMLSLHIAELSILAVNRWQLPIHVDRQSDIHLLLKRLPRSTLLNCLTAVSVWRVVPRGGVWS